MCSCESLCVYTCVSEYMCVSLPLCLFVHVCVHVCLCVHVCACLCVCVYACMLVSWAEQYWRRMTGDQAKQLGSRRKPKAFSSVSLLCLMPQEATGKQNDVLVLCILEMGSVAPMVCSLGPSKLGSRFLLNKIQTPEHVFFPSFSINSLRTSFSEFW